MVQIADKRFDIDDRASCFLFFEGRDELQQQVCIGRHGRILPDALMRNFDLITAFSQHVCEVIPYDNHTVTAPTTNDPYVISSHIE